MSDAMNGHEEEQLHAKMEQWRRDIAQSPKNKAKNIGSVEFLRLIIPSLIKYCFGLKDEPGQKKVRGMWSERPRTWKPDVPYVDPNNGQKANGGKPKKEILSHMFRYLSQLYFEKRGTMSSDMYIQGNTHLDIKPAVSVMNSHMERKRSLVKVEPAEIVPVQILRDPMVERRQRIEQKLQYVLDHMSRTDDVNLLLHVRDMLLVILKVKGDDEEWKVFLLEQSSYFECSLDIIRETGHLPQKHVTVWNKFIEMAQMVNWSDNEVESVQKPSTLPGISSGVPMELGREEEVITSHTPPPDVYGGGGTTGSTMVPITVADAEGGVMGMEMQFRGGDGGGGGGTTVLDGSQLQVQEMITKFGVKAKTIATLDDLNADGILDIRVRVEEEPVTEKKNLEEKFQIAEEFIAGDLLGLEFGSNLVPMQDEDLKLTQLKAVSKLWDDPFPQSKPDSSVINQGNTTEKLPCFSDFSKVSEFNGSLAFDFESLLKKPTETKENEKESAQTEVNISPAQNLLQMMQSTETSFIPADQFLELNNTIVDAETVMSDPSTMLFGPPSGQIPTFVQDMDVEMEEGEEEDPMFNRFDL